MFQISKQLKNSLLFFGIAALLGSYLRAFPLLPSWANYKFILHTHSHIALIGWVYLFLSGLIVERYTNYLNSRFYKILYKTSIYSIIGMMLSFPIQGYALWSIVFSTLFLVVSYLLLYWILKSKNDFALQSSSFKFIKSGLYYLAISSIGPWALGLMELSSPNSSSSFLALDRAFSFSVQRTVSGSLLLRYSAIRLAG